jgi:hypothetical protein
MTMSRHEPFAELISASLRGDLTADERARLDAHLDGCADCRATLAAFSDGRRIVAGLRHVPPPRDLDARVRAGIERGTEGGLPWWRRQPMVFAGVGGGAALVAGALLAVVLLNRPDGPSVGQATPTASAVSPSATAPVIVPSPSANSSARPTIVASPSEPPPPASPEPDVFVAVTGPFDDPSLTVRDAEGAELLEADAPSGEPIAAELSPDGQWLAVITVRGLSGQNEVRAIRIADAPPGAPSSPVGVGATVPLGPTKAGGPFLEHLFWSPDGTALAYTLQDPEDGSIDAWLFEPASGTRRQLTDVGNAYAASWVAAEGPSLLWVSEAGETPRSYLITPSASDEAVDPTTSPYPHAEDVFQPLVSPDGDLVIFWSGQMSQPEAGEWSFIQAGQAWVADNVHDGAGGYTFDNARKLFSDLTIGRDGFESAAIAWGDDSDAYAVWDAAYTGTTDGTYPDRNRVYFSHASDPEAIRADHALDAADLPADAFVVDVKVSPTGRHLVVTAGRPRPGDLAPATADLLLITRNTGSTADEVTTLGSADDGWFGPAAFDRVP